MIKNQIQQFELFVFDLDGTLINSAEDIARAANYARSQLGLSPIPLDTIKKFVGWGAKKLIQDVFDSQDPETIQKGLEVFFSYYKDHLVDHTQLYPGVQAFLDWTQEGNSPKINAILTNKPRFFSEHILKELKVDVFFSMLIGGDDTPARKPNPQGLQKIMRELNVNPEKTCFIGDTLIDLETGKNAGVFTVLVSYPQGAFLKKEDLVKLNPDLLVEGLTQLLD